MEIDSLTAASVSIAIVLLAVISIHPLMLANSKRSDPARVMSTLSLLIASIALFNLVNRDIGFIYLVPFAIATYFVVYIDIKTHRIPNQINLLLALAMSLTVPIWKFMDPDWEISPIFIGGISLFIIYFFLNLISGNRIGMGDVKLAYSAGMASGSFGVYGVTLATLIAFTLAGFFALLLLVTRRAKLQSEFAFGPFMILGTWLSLLILNTFGQIQ